MNFSFNCVNSSVILKSTTVCRAMTSPLTLLLGIFSNQLDNFGVDASGLIMEFLTLSATLNTSLDQQAYLDLILITRCAQ